MKAAIFNVVSRITAFFKQIRFQQVFMVVLAGVLLLTTACSPNSPSSVGQGSYDQRYNQQTGLREYTDRGDAARRPGMSSFKDNDARQTRALNAKANDLVRRAQQNVNKVNSPGDFVESYRQGKPLNERVEDLSKDVGNAANQFKRDLSTGTQENARNLQTNADKAKQNAQRTGRDVSKTVQRGVDDAADAVQDGSRNAANAVRDRA